MKNADIRIQVQRLQEVRLTSQLKVSPAQLFPWKQENKHALLDVYQTWVLPRTHRTRAYPSCTQLRWAGKTQGSFLVHISAIWNNWNWSEHAWSRSRALNSGAGLIAVCATILISKPPLKKSEVNIPYDSKATLLQFSKLPSQSRGLASPALASPENEGLLDQERWCYNLLTIQNVFLKQANKQKTNTKKPHPPHPPKTIYGID